MNSELYIGLMSGTSMDAVDCALVDLGAPDNNYLLDFINVDLPASLRTQLETLCHQPEISLRLLGETDIAMAELFASAALSIIEKNQLNSSQIHAIGSHGQTVYHQPPGQGKHPFSLQIADPNTISALTGITTVADFRRKDMALGGQGAPLLPLFHHHLFNSIESNRIILNIGGMANITLLRRDDANVVGFDTGPGNILLDGWIHAQQGHLLDHEGSWAASGNVNQDFLAFLLEDTYFATPAPKSTGREYFNLDWLNRQIEHFGRQLDEADIQATLCVLTSRTVADAITNLLPDGEVIVCGGGAANKQLMHNLSEDLSSFRVSASDSYGINSSALEAVAFAWFAKQTLNRTPLDLSQITGSSRPTILGGIYYAE
jgi:anhydro-N-acetylmuramic acid kinase